MHLCRDAPLLVNVPLTDKTVLLLSLPCQKPVELSAASGLYSTECYGYLSCIHPWVLDDDQNPSNFVCVRRLSVCLDAGSVVL